MKSKKTKKRNLIVLIAAIVALVLLSVSLVFALRSALADEESSEKTTSSSSSSASKEEESDEPDEPSTETNPPESGDGNVEIETSQEKLQMQSALRLDTYSLINNVKNVSDISDSEKIRPKLGFGLRLSDLAKREIEMAYSLQILIAEKTDFEKLNPSKLDYVDWLPLFKSSGFSYFLRDVTEFEEVGNKEWTAKAWTDPLPMKKYNTEYYAVAVLNVRDGYQYTTFAEYEKYARSVAYNASCALAENSLAVLCGYPQYSDLQVYFWELYISGSYHLAKGFDSILFKGATYEFNADSSEIALTVGKTYQINYSQSPSGVRLGYRFYVLSKSVVIMGTGQEDDSVVTVSEDGVITAIGKGTAYVYVFGGGDSMIRKVTVT